MQMHIATVFINTLLPPFSRHFFNTHSSMARSGKDDQLLNTLSDICLVAGCLNCELSQCPQGHGLANALLESSA